MLLKIDYGINNIDSENIKLFFLENRFKNRKLFITNSKVSYRIKLQLLKTLRKICENFFAHKLCTVQRQNSN